MKYKATHEGLLPCQSTPLLLEIYITVQYLPLLDCGGGVKWLTMGTYTRNFPKIINMHIILSKNNERSMQILVHFVLVTSTLNTTFPNKTKYYITLNFFTFKEHCSFIHIKLRNIKFIYYFIDNYFNMILSINFNQSRYNYNLI